MSLVFKSLSVGDNLSKIYCLIFRKESDVKHLKISAAMSALATTNQTVSIKVLTQAESGCVLFIHHQFYWHLTRSIFLGPLHQV